MKIALLADRLVMGGLETHIISTVNELLKRGHRILLNTAYLNPELLSKFHHAQPLFQFRPWSDSFREDLESFGPDLIHAHPFTAIFRGYEAACHFQKPLIVTMHGLYDFGLDRSDLGNRVSNLVQAIIAVDPRVASVLTASTAHPEKIRIIYNGIDLDEFRPLPLKKTASHYDDGWNPNWKTLVIVSRLADGKERPIYQVMDCLPVLVNRLNGLNVYVVGDGSGFDTLYAKADQIKQMSEKLHLQLVGSQMDVRKFLAVADLVLACDRAAVEAMASGKTVFA
jgi:glycosyltransferase involved in cell wall biosynthesis